MASRKMTGLILLTREGCGNTPEMRTNPEEALRQLNAPRDYTVLDVSALDESDPRRGYPTPTVLFEGRDLFGMEVSQPPFPEPG